MLSRTETSQCLLRSSKKISCKLFISIHSHTFIHCSTESLTPLIGRSSPFCKVPPSAGEVVVSNAEKRATERDGVINYRDSL